MILTMDIGNTNIKCAIFDGSEMLNYWRISTNRTMTSDEYGMLMLNLFTHNKLETSKIGGIVISSVVPTINYTIDHMCMTYFGMQPMFVAPGIKTGIHIKYDNPRELGSDRIANAVAAYELYGGPCIFIDFGTATSFGVVSEKGEFLGGAICPGVKLSLDALTGNAAKLPNIELNIPPSAIGKNTVTSMQSGLLFGYVGLVESLISRFKDEMSAPHARVIATGGMSKTIGKLTPAIDVLDPLLTLEGLKLLYHSNQ